MSEISVTAVIEQFTAKQREAFQAVLDKNFVLYGGARGGGKSYWLRWSLLLLLLYWYNVEGKRGVRVGLFCEDYPSLKDRQMDRIATEFGQYTWLGSIKETQTGGLGYYLTEANGSGAIMFRNLDNPSKYTGAEFAAIGVDQIEKNKYNVFEILLGSKRWPGINNTKFLATANPIGVGHIWVKGLWIDKVFEGNIAKLKDEFAFIQSLPTDNPYLSQDYWDNLNSLNPELRRAWVEGDWNIFEGQAFSRFSEERHVIEAFEIPESWVKWCGIDWGYRRPFVCLWLTSDPETGRIYVYRELSERELTDREQARRILEWTLPEEIIAVTYADPAMWARKNVANIVTSTADEYRAEGLILTRGDNNRLNGKRKIDRLLTNLSDGKPGLQIFDNCLELIKNLPSLPYSETIPEDIDTNANDDEYDALRYALTRIVKPKMSIIDKNNRNPWREFDYGRKSVYRI